MAPEIVSKVDHVPVYTDMWSLGVLFYVMLQGNYPFRAKTEEELFEKIRRGKFTYIYDNISDKSKELIEALLKVNPYERLTVNDVLSERYYDWLLEKN
jgi:serine/threonine protein kinase